jgi:hypothetical protein
MTSDMAERSPKRLHSFTKKCHENRKRIGGLLGRNLLCIFFSELLFHFFLHPFFLQFIIAIGTGINLLFTGKSAVAVLHGNSTGFQLHGAMGIIGTAFSHSILLLEKLIGKIR